MTGPAAIPFAYDTVQLTSRPPRPVVAYETGPDWTTAAFRCLRWLSTVWGGAGGAVVPLSPPDASTPASRVLLAAVRAFDPDTVVYRPVVASDVSDDELRKHVDPATADRTIELLRADQPDLPLPGRPSGWEATFIRWCAAKQPYDDLDDTATVPHFLPLNEDVDDPAEPFTSAAAVAGRNVRSVAFDLDAIHPLLALMVASRSGVSSPGRPAATIVPGDDDLHGLAQWAVTGTVDPGRLPCVDVRVGSPDAGSIRGETLLRAMPLPATATGVSWLTPPMHRYAPTVLVVGDSADDHAFALLADRTLNTSAWMPASLLTDGTAAGDAARYAAATFLQRFRHASVRRPTLVTSTSLDVDAVTELIAGVAGRDLVTVVDAGDVAFEHMKVLADPAAASRPSTHPVVKSNGTVTLLSAVEPPVPAAVVDVDDVTWMVDVWPGRSPAPPPRATLRSSLLLSDADGDAGFPETQVRSSRHGVTFWSLRQGLVLAGALPGSSFARPRLRFPGAAATVESLAAAAGMTATQSVVGQRALSVADMWGGADLLAADLQGPVRRLIGLLADRAENTETDWGCGVEHRHCVTFDGASRLLATDPTESRRTLDRLLETGVVRRGLVLGCARCSNVAFYRTAAVSDSFTCTRCGHDNMLLQPRWRAPQHEPHWFYDLDPLVTAFIEQNGDVPLVAAQTILDRHREPGTSTFETEFRRAGDPGPWIEVDFVCVAAGRLYVGEAKSNGSLVGKRSVADTAQRLATLAVSLNVDQVTLATSTARWADGHVEAVRDAVRREAEHHGAPEPSVEAFTVTLGLPADASNPSQPDRPDGEVAGSNGDNE